MGAGGKGGGGRHYSPVFGFWFLNFLIIPDEIFYLGNLLGHIFGDLTACFLQRNERNERSEHTDELTLAGPNDGWMDG